MDMKFDYVIGNPPYQEESGGDSTGTNPVYHYFFDSAISVSDYVELITPARFLFNAGKTPKAWNEKMLSDRHFKVLMYSQDPNKVFPGVPITGGVVVSCWNANADYTPIGTFVPYDELRSIIEKVREYNHFTSIRDIIHVHSKFDLDKVIARNNKYRSMIGSEGRDRRVRANAMEKFDFFTEDRKSPTDVRVLGLIQNKRSYRYINRDLLEHDDWVDKYKVFVPESNGASGMLGEEAARIISKPVCGVPGDGVTQTFIVVGSMNTEYEADSLYKYIMSKFLRVLLGSLKATQRNNAVTWENVPLQNFTPTSDIDRQLYRKYGLTDEEIAFIESHVKEMT